MQTPLLTEKEFRMFMRPRRRHTLVFTILYILGTIAIMAGAFFALNAASYLRIQPLPNYVAVTTPLPATATPVIPAAIAPVSTPTPSPSATSNLPNNTVSYDAKNISAPVSWDTAFTTNAIDQNLENGVIHIAGTPRPGEQGMTVLFGHSSNYVWAKGNYKNIFAPLIKAQVGDTFEISYKNIDYTYKVTKAYQVNADDLAVLNSSTNESGARLITCTPIGTSLYRYVVEGTQISPNPAGNTPYTQHSFTGSLPADS